MSLRGKRLGGNLPCTQDFYRYARHPPDLQLRSKGIPIHPRMGRNDGANYSKYRDCGVWLVFPLTLNHRVGGSSPSQPTYAFNWRNIRR